MPAAMALPIMCAAATPQSAILCESACATTARPWRLVPRHVQLPARQPIQLPGLPQLSAGGELALLPRDTSPGPMAATNILKERGLAAAAGGGSTGRSTGRSRPKRQLVVNAFRSPAVPQAGYPSRLMSQWAVLQC